MAYRDDLMTDEQRRSQRHRRHAEIGEDVFVNAHGPQYTLHVDDDRP